eukprot:gene7269-9908_t
MRVLYTFGLNEDGQCGNGGEETLCKINSNIVSPSPVKFLNNIIIAQISLGSRHSLALSSDGCVYSWGWGHHGQLGLGNNNSIYSPIRIDSLRDIVMISAGGMHSACIDGKKLCYTWGSSSYGQLGLGREIVGINKSVTPAVVKLEDRTPLLSNKISCGGMHTAVVDINGSVYSWGRADSGQTGYSDWYLEFFPGLTYPKKVQGFEGKAIDVSCGGFHTIILTDHGSVYAMGKEDFGLLGIGDQNADNMAIGAESPTLLRTFYDNNIPISSISAGGWHSCFLSDFGDIYTCGKGEYGRLGLGDEKSTIFPTAITGITDTLLPTAGLIKDDLLGDKNTNKSKAVHISCGGSHTIVSTDSNSVFSFGRVDGGRLGIGNAQYDRVTKPADITDQFKRNYGNGIACSEYKEIRIIQVCAGGSHSAVLIEYIE